MTTAKDTWENSCGNQETRWTPKILVRYAKQEVKENGKDKEPKQRLKK